MRRGLATACIALFLAGVAVGCGERQPIEAEDLLVRVEIDVDQVELGQGFPLTVVRVWNEAWEPSSWDDGLLAPLVVRLEASSRREDGIRVEERRRYRAYAFTLGNVSVPSVRITARPRTGGRKRLAMTEPIVLTVVRAFDGQDAGAPELPGEPMSEPRPALPYLIGLGFVLVALVAGLRQKRRGSTVSAATSLPPTARDRALESLEALGARSPDGEVVAEVADVVRDYLAEMYEVDARHRTTPELVAEARTFLVSPQVAELDDLLARADLVKYAAHVVTPESCADHLEEAAALVRETGSANP